MIEMDPKKVNFFSYVEKRRFFEGYWTALTVFGIWNDGERHIGVMKTNIKDVANTVWWQLFPECECDRPMQECSGCMTDR